MEFNTKKSILEISKAISDLSASLDEQTKRLEHSISTEKENFINVLNQQREELIRISLEMERIYKEDKHRRTIALKRFKSE